MSDSGTSLFEKCHQAMENCTTCSYDEISVIVSLPSPLASSFVSSSSSASASSFSFSFSFSFSSSSSSNLTCFLPSSSDRTLDRIAFLFHLCLFCSQN
jgi:hypothetical protein